MSDQTNPAHENQNNFVQLSVQDYNELKKMSEYCSRLSARIHGLENAANKSRPIIENYREPNVAEPQHFYGKREELMSFLTQIRLVFELQPSRFNSERQKVLYTVSFLRGTASNWFQPFLAQKPTPDMLDDFEDFVDALKKAFGNPNQSASAEREIRNLKQTTSVSTYSSDFQRLAAFLEWNDAAKISQYYWGLKDSIKDEFAKVDRPNNLSELITLAIKIDTRIYERHIEKRYSSFAQNKYTSYSQQNNYEPATNSTQFQATRYEPMEVDSIGPKAKRGPLSVEERKHRFENKLCMYCARPDHFASKCPLRPSAKINAANLNKDTDYQQYLKFIEFRKSLPEFSSDNSSGKASAQSL